MAQSLRALADFITSTHVASLLRVHPNDIPSLLEVSSNDAPSRLWDWWCWASPDQQSKPSWKKVLDSYYGDILDTTPNIPPSVTSLLTNIKALQRPREPISIAPYPAQIYQDKLGQSPKKIHEVSRAVSYIVNLLQDQPTSTDLTNLRIVDIGAGQGYLTRALAYLLASKYKAPDSLSERILAIDSNDLQTHGAQRWETQSAKSKLSKESIRPPPIEGLIRHKVLHASSENLLHSIDEWINEDPKKEVPVLFVALHACGSLTVNVLRAFLHAVRDANNGSRKWHPLAAVIVGCCYNLLDPSDFPLSTELGQRFDSTEKDSWFPSSAYHLATQAPSTYYLTNESAKQFELSVRKVVWRAILESFIQSSTSVDKQEPPLGNSLRKPHVHDPPLGILGTGRKPTLQRLGKLNDKIYENWGTFLQEAGKKMGCTFDETACTGPPRDLENQLATLHVLRCLCGPVLETILLEDRRSWLEEELKELVSGTSIAFKVDLINLFDQNTGSARNMAITITH